MYLCIHVYIRKFKSSQREEGDGQSGAGSSAMHEAKEVDTAQLNNLVSP